MSAPVADRPLPTVLMVGPMPPPPLLGGIETGIALLFRTPLARASAMTLFNTWRTPDPTRSALQKLRYQLGMSWKFFATVARVRPTIVHVKAASGINYYQCAAYVMIARLARRRVLLQLHAGDFPQFYDRAGPLGQAIIGHSLRLPHRLVALSESWATYFSGLAQREHIGVVPNALVVAEYADAKPDRARFRIPAGRVAVLFVGTRDPAFDVQKGLPELLRAMQAARVRRSELFLVLAGGAPDSEAITQALGPEGEAWTHVGTVTGEAKAALFRTADILALPSYFENMPNTVLEAMAAGRPVVATPVGAIPEMVEEGASGFLVPVGDADQLADRLALLAADPTLRDRMGARARALADQRYDMAVLERALTAEYRDTVGADVGDTAAAPIVWFRRPAVQQRLRLLTRLASMSPREIAHRVGRVVDKRRRRGVDTTPSVVTLPAALDTHPVRHLRTRTAGSGFFSSADRDAIVARARTYAGDDVARTLRDADVLLRHGIDLLGKRFRPADADFDWLADPDHGRAWPSHILDDADAVRRVRVDVKFVWEVNRHQFFVTLARAFAYSGDERYAEACVAMARSWRSANPVGVGVNWASNLEVAVRSLAWVWTIQLLLGSRALTDDELRPWLESLANHREHLAQHLSTFTDPTNHLIGEVAALAVVTTWLPELPRSAELRDTALAALDRELVRQVADHGWDREQSCSYQRFVLDFALQVIAIGDANHADVPAGIRQRARAMVAAVGTLLSADLRAPRIGDSDDARALPFFREDLWDFSELLAVGAAVLDAPELSPRPASSYESALWLGGERALRARATPPSAARSEMLGDDYAILRPRRAASSDRLVFDCGPLGYLPHASHGHGDLLSVLVDVAGEEVLVDPSSFAYYDERGRRDAYRATRAHNTVEIGGRDQADAFDPFKWLNIPRNGITTRELGPAFDYVEAWHDGYCRLRPAVRHRRGVLGLDGGWVIVDWLEGRGTQRIARWFHAAPSTRLERVDDRTLQVACANGRAALSIRNVTSDDDGAAVEATQTPYSERYGHECRAPAVRIVERCALPAVRVTLLAAAAPGRAPLVLAATQGSVMHGALVLQLVESDGHPVEVAVRAANGPVSVGPTRIDGRIVVAAGSHRLRSGDTA